MKKTLLTVGLGLAITLGSFAQEYKIITSVESIVPMGIGRSRIIEGNTPVNYKDFTSERIDGKKEKGKEKIKRGDAKIGNFSETKMLNFYSGVGINFQNVASNDAMLSSMLNDMTKKGWALIHVVSGVESDSGKGDGKGIYITRFIFKK